MTDWNAHVIEEFRANEGKVGGNFEGAPLLLLHTTGAGSGLERVNPPMYQALDNGRLAVFASKAGADTDPDHVRQRGEDHRPGDEPAHAGPLRPRRRPGGPPLSAWE